MTRPQIIRADTIDLQDHNAPSAKDHTRQPEHPAPLGAGPPAPHQAEMLREHAPDSTDISRDWHDDGSVDGAGQDRLAVAQNGGHTGSTAEDGDLADAEGDDGMDDDMMDKISSSPSIDDEDIDFEFVYALHTFVATVEGQANATKGDTMVLLDDSNSYWWLVRVVKDSSIGYLPAEHIETPTERLARLNKHRNIDLTSTMLGDSTEKAKNPLKKAIRRKYSKTVSFAAPTYVEASDVDYSTEEEDNGDVFGQQEQQAEVQDQAEEDEISPVEPLRPRAELRDQQSDSANQDADRADSAARASSDNSRTSDEVSEGRPEGNRSRNGTVRNTDSFFKDDSMETRKITLTPNLLRDDSSTPRTSNESKEYRQRASLEKDSASDRSKIQKDKKDKKDKDKKSGMLSGLFKRKDKRTKSQDDDIDELMGKRSLENARASPAPSKDSEEGVLMEEQAQKPNKLQKHPRGEVSPTRRPNAATESKNIDPTQPASLERSVQAPSMRLVQSEDQVDDDEIAQQSEVARGSSPIESSATEIKPALSVSTTLQSDGTTASDSQPAKAKKAVSRMELDESDSSPEISPMEETAQDQSKLLQRPIPGAFPDSYTGQPTSNVLDERLSESPVQVSPISNSQSYPPALTVDTSSQEEPSSPVSSPSPELIDAEEARDKKGPDSATTTASMSTWSDAHLRTFFDDDSEIKDLLIVIYDKSGVVPAGPDHPVTGDLFREENAKLADITNRLDSMLGDWLARKMRTQPVS